MAVGVPPVFKGAIEGWYLLAPSGKRHTASPSSSACQSNLLSLVHLRFQLLIELTSMRLAITCELSTFPSP